MSAAKVTIFVLTICLAADLLVLSTYTVVMHSILFPSGKESHLPEMLLHKTVTP